MAQAKDALPFDAATWGRLQEITSRPLAVVFTTTDCEYCPAVIDRLARKVHRAGSKAKLAVVVMDVVAKEDPALSNGHYDHADLFYVFAAEPERLRYAVDPAWRGITPYVVLIDRAGLQHRFFGLPPAGELERLLTP